VFTSSSNLFRGNENEITAVVIYKTGVWLFPAAEPFGISPDAEDLTYLVGQQIISYVINFIAVRLIYDNNFI
jgi:hypothetical protein